MKHAADSEECPFKESPSKGSCLDVCYLQSVVSKDLGLHVMYYMTLLAHAVIKGNMKMIDLLIKENAGKFHCNFYHTWMLFLKTL